MQTPEYKRVHLTPDEIDTIKRALASYGGPRSYGRITSLLDEGTPVDLDVYGREVVK